MCKNTTYNNKSIKTIIYIICKTKLHQNLNTELILVKLHCEVLLKLINPMNDSYLVIVKSSQSPNNCHSSDLTCNCT